MQVSSRSNLASSEPSKPFCETHTQPNSALTSELVQPNQSFLPHSSALSLEAALLSIRSCQCGSGVPSHTDQTNFIFGQHSSVLPSELGSPSEKPCQRVSTLMDLAQPTQIPSSQSSAQPWDFSQPTVALCQHSSEFSDTFQACDSLSNVLTEDLPTTDLPALGDLTEGSALLSQLEFDIAQTHELL